MLRIEDVDEPRSRRGAEDAILRTLARYGFVWDGAVERQSLRTSAYQEALATLIERGHAYPCACTRSELALLPLAGGGERVYPGTCRAGLRTDRARRHPAWRARVNDAVIRSVDRLQGPQSQALQTEVGDFVIKRADGLFAYQLAVVVDDAAQGVTDVVRGADLLSSTPRQIHLQRLLGLDTPSYLHVPIAINGASEKLSKQTHAPALPDDALVALLAAWRFLDQPAPMGEPQDVAAFWRHALAQWTPTRLPPVSMLPAPPRFAN